MKGMTGGDLGPLAAFQNELKIRYYSFFVAGPSIGARLRLLIPLCIVGAFSYLLLSGEFRRRWAAKLLLVVTVTGFLVMMAADNLRFSVYLVHLFPLYWALATVALWSMFASRRALGIGFAACLCVVVAMEGGIIVYKASDYKHKNSFEEMLKTVRRQPSARQALIMGPSQFIFGLRPGYRLEDDARLGYYSGLHPDLIISPVEGTQPASFREQEPLVTEYMTDLLEHRSELIFRNSDFSLYRSNTKGKVSPLASAGTGATIAAKTP
jgi:hypothetical protein